jgi:hypothetical protein
MIGGHKWRPLLRLRALDALSHVAPAGTPLLVLESSWRSLPQASSSSTSLDQQHPDPWYDDNNASRLGRTELTIPLPRRPREQTDEDDDDRSTATRHHMPKPKTHPQAEGSTPPPPPCAPRRPRTPRRCHGDREQDKHRYLRRHVPPLQS